MCNVFEKDGIVVKSWKMTNIWVEYRGPGFNVFVFVWK